MFQLIPFVKAATNVNEFLVVFDEKNSETNWATKSEIIDVDDGYYGYAVEKFEILDNQTMKIFVQPIDLSL